MADEWGWEGIMGAEEGALDYEIKGTDEVSLSSRLHKTEEEIQKFSVDESFTDVERAVHLLKHGALSQKLSVVSSLTKLISEYPDEFKTAILPILLEIVPVEPGTFQKALGTVMTELITAFALPTKFIQMMNPISRKLMDSKDEDVVNVWADVFIATIKHIPIDTIIQQILPEALVDGGLAQPAPFRIWCGRVLGAAASRLDPKKIEDTFLHKALNLCQDTDYEVRKSMCQQLNVIAKAVGLKLTKSDIIPEYMELLMDEEDVVRQAAIENVMSLLEFLDSETKIQSIIPLWKKLCEEKLKCIMPLLLKHLGSFLYQTRNEMNEADKRYFLAFYHSMASSSDSEYRTMCAYNFPGIVLTYKPQLFEQNKMDKILEALTSDQNSQAHKHLAAGFHELTNLLGAFSYRILKSHFVRIISSSNVEVLLAACPNFDVILKNMSLDEQAKQPNGFIDILTAILTKLKECESSAIMWRPIYTIVTLFPTLADYVDSELIFEQAIPPLFRLMSDCNAIPIRKLVIKTLVLLLRKLKRNEHREVLLKYLLELREDRSCHQRMLFLDMCDAILDVFSRRFFRDHIFHHFLGFSRDPVANLRLKFISLIPSVRRTLRIPIDSQMLQKLMDATEPLLTRDADGDVMESMSSMLKKFGPLEKEGYGDLKTQDDIFGLGFASFSLGLAPPPIPSPSSSIPLRKNSVVGRAPATPAPINKSNSRSSLTDEYLKIHTWTRPRATDSQDKLREEEEQKLMFDLLGSDFTTKRRELHDARQEFHRRFGEKDQKGRRTSMGVGGPQTSVPAPSVGRATAPKGGPSSTAQASPRKRVVGSTSGSTSSASPSIASSTASISSIGLATSSVVSSTSSIISVSSTIPVMSSSATQSLSTANHNNHRTTTLNKTFGSGGSLISATDGSLGSSLTSSNGLSVPPMGLNRKKIVSGKSVNKKTSSITSEDTDSPKSSSLQIGASNNMTSKKLTDELRNLEMELMNAANAPLNLSKAGAAATTVAPLPKMSVGPNTSSALSGGNKNAFKGTGTTALTSARPNTSDRVPELPLHGSVKTSSKYR